MKPEQVFAIANLVAMSGWILLALFPWRRTINTYVAGRGIPLLLALLYASVFALHGREGSGGFGSLAAVAQLFENRWILLAGWTHYLAFDLFIGAWEARDAQRLGMNRFLLLSCQFLTFMLGPIGLLCYFLLRAVSQGTRRTRAAEPMISA